MGTAKATRRQFKPPRCFRLRTLLLLLSAIALLCGWEVGRLQRRANAIALLNRWGLEVTAEPVSDRLPWSLIPDMAFSFGTPRPTICESVSFMPDWFYHASLLEDAVDPLPMGERRTEPSPPMAAGASLRERKQLVAAIATLDELPWLQVPFELDDDDLRVPSRLENLEELCFKIAGLTDSGVESILKLRKIWDLTIDFDSRGCLPPEIVARLGALPRLMSMSIAPLPAGRAARVKAAQRRTERQNCTERKTGSVVAAKEREVAGETVKHGCSMPAASISFLYSRTRTEESPTRSTGRRASRDLKKRVSEIGHPM